MSIEAVPKLHLTLSSERFVLLLLDQQFYCWGKDIERPCGNHLIELGFVKTAAPARVGTTSSAYEKVFGGAYLCLWGFGLFYGKKGHGGIFLSRHKFPPLMTSLWKQPEPHWAYRQAKELSCPRTEIEIRSVYSLLGSVFTWISKFEESILKVSGETYRRKIISERKLRSLPERLVPSAWSEFALACDAESPYEAFRQITKRYKPQTCKLSDQNGRLGAENKFIEQTTGR